MQQGTPKLVATDLASVVTAMVRLLTHHGLWSGFYSSRLQVMASECASMSHTASPDDCVSSHYSSSDSSSVSSSASSSSPSPLSFFSASSSSSYITIPSFLRPSAYSTLSSSFSSPATSRIFGIITLRTNSPSFPPQRHRTVR